MDKYEYQVCADKIKSLIGEGKFAEAMDIADGIDWRRVKSFSMLCTVSEIYKVNKHYEESRDILLLAYERYPDRASVVYALCELEIKLGNLKEAKSFYKEYVALKPTDTNRYVLLYRLYEVMDYSLEDKIALLEEFKRNEYTEKWAYELAVLYHKTGQEKKCVDTCDELILWFGDGTYVKKALELKKQHSKLTEDQQRKYDGTDTPVKPAPIPRPQAGGMPEVAANSFNTGAMQGQYNVPNEYQTGAMPQNGMTNPMMQANPMMPNDYYQNTGMLQNTAPQNMAYNGQTGSFYNTSQTPQPQQMMGGQFYSTQDLIQPGYNPYAQQQYQQTAPQPYMQQYADPYGQQPMYNQQPYNDPYAQQQYQQTAPQPYVQQYVDPYNTQPQMPVQEPTPVDEYDGIQVKVINTDKFSTMNLQAELAKGMADLYSKDAEINQANSYYGNTSALYEPSQQQYQQQLNMAGNAPSEEYYANEQYYQNQNGYQPEYPTEYSADYPVEEPVEELVEMPVPVMASANVAVPVINNIEENSEAAVSEEPVKEPVEEPVNETYAESNTESDTESYEEPYTVESVEAEPEDIKTEPVTEKAQPPATDEVVKAPDVQAEPITEQVPVSQPAADNSQNIQVSAGKEAEPVKESVPKSLEKELSQEYDGQISMSLPDPDMEIKQITGQIDISDFLKEWEEKKRNGEKQRQEDFRRKQLEQTNDIMAQLIDVIPGFTVTYDNNISEEAKAPEVMPGVDSEIEATIIPEADIPAVSTVLPEVGGVAAGLAAGVAAGAAADAVAGASKREPEEVKPIVIPDYLMEEINEKKREAGIEIPEDSANTEESAEGVSEDTVETSADNAESVVETEIEAETETEQDDVTVADAPSDEIEEASAKTEVKADTASKYNTEKIVAEELSKNDELDEEAIKAILDAEEKALANSIGFGDFDNTSEATEDNSTEEVPEEEIPSEEVTDETVKADAETDAANNEPVKYPFEVTDYGTVEEIDEIEQPDEDDIFKTDAIPVIDYKEEDYEVSEDEAEEDSEDDKPSNNLPSYMKLERRRESRRNFDYEEMRIFGRFEGIEPLKAQIVDVVDDMSMESSYGNVIVTGSEIYGRKSLAIDIVKAIQALDTQFSGKVAKISGEALNKKDIPMTLHKLHNGALIVESAGGLDPVTINSMIEILASNVEPILVVLEDEVSEMEPILAGCKEMATVFNARIEMDDFSNDDLVAYARGYARELEYSIDEMGELALHTRISELQSSIDDIVTVDDIKDIVDAAIRHADRKNMSHFMDTLLAKRYDDDDYIILREKDFIF